MLGKSCYFLKVVSKISSLNISYIVFLFNIFNYKQDFKKVFEVYVMGEFAGNYKGILYTLFK